MALITGLRDHLGDATKLFPLSNSSPQRAWCFTLNNYHDRVSEEEYKALDARFLICGYEEGEEGTPHIQGYVEFNKPVRRAHLRKVLGPCHAEPRKATAYAAAVYCQKEGDWDEWGKWPAYTGTQGKRNDLLALRDAIKEGKRGRELLEDDATCASFFKYQRGIDAALEIYDEVPMRDDIQVMFFYGGAGVGKSTYARKQLPDAYWKDGTKWWYGYNGQKDLIWDEFNGSCCTPTDFNRIFDFTPHPVEQKGRCRSIAVTRAIIISNYLPSTWWSSERAQLNLETLTRRFHGIAWFQVKHEEPRLFSSWETFDAAMRGVDL